MCGIVGIFDSKEPVDRDLLKRMTDVLSHRGPDREGFFIHKSRRMGLGFRRLSIIDLLKGNQPLTNEDDSIHLVFNGEIYNFQEMRKELKTCGHRFKTDSDTECIVHGYEEYGDKVFSKLNGMFAIGLWDEGKKRLVLARDRAGEKPLHYFFDGRTFIFASELKSIVLHPAVDKTIDWGAFDEYFSYGFISAPESIYRTIKKIEPGNYLVFENNQIKHHTYWQLNMDTRFTGDYLEAQTGCTRLLEDAVKIRLISDVPLGAFLSGGIDSSAVVAFMAKHSTHPVKTFSIGFREDDFDERKYARQVAEMYGTQHTELVVTADFSRYIEDLLLNFDEPFGDPSALPTHILAKLTREHVTVALSGDGGDELFGGYKTYKYLLRQIKKVNRFPKIFKTLARLMLHAVPERSYLGKRLWILAANEPERFIETVTTFDHTGKMELFSDAVKEALNDHFCETRDKKMAFFKGNIKVDFQKQMQFSDFKHYLPDDILVKVDRATMLASLESRAPFLDHRLIEFLFSLPSQWKFNRMDSKIILKDILRDSLPGEILEREKMGFGVPLEDWFTGKLIDYYRDILVSPQMDRFFNRQTVQRYLKEHKERKVDRSYEIWLSLAFVLWWRQNGE